MANERLRAALDRRRASIEAVAVAAEVDPKTVGRWLGGRTPHPRHRWVVAKFLHEDEEFLWPGVQRRSADPSSANAEIVAAYPYRSDMPKSTWSELINGAKRQIDLLGYTLYFLPMDHPELIETLQQKCADGCKIRAIIARSDSKYVKDRDDEEDLALTLVVRIQTSLKFFAPLFACDNFEMREQDAPLHNSIFRFDEEMLVTPHLYATPGSAAPLLRLRRLGPSGMFSRFATHFDSLWAPATPVRHDQLKKGTRRSA
jgi:lambda repressor-like predicted transcriptional regulator